MIWKVLDKFSLPPALVEITAFFQNEIGDWILAAGLPNQDALGLRRVTEQFAYTSPANHLLFILKYWRKSILSLFRW